MVLKRRTWTKPDGSLAQAYRMCFANPDDPSGPLVYETCDATNKAGATREAIKKHQALAVRKQELADGGTRHTGKTVRQVVEGYLDRLAHETREATVVNYRPCLERFVAWCEGQGIDSVDELRPGHVAAFRAFLASMPRASGDTKPLSRASVNSYMRPVRACLFALRKARELPHLTDQDLGDTLEAVKEPKSKKPHLNTGEVGTLLRACLLHDGERCDLTRAEKAGDGEAGSTARYAAVAPFVAFLVLSGCRVNEALAIRWADVDLDAPDDQGKPVGSVRLRAEEVKTGHERQVGLEVSPGLRKILQAMKARAGADVRVFSALTFDAARAAARRLLFRCDACRAADREACGEWIKPEAGKKGPERLCLGAPAFGWQKLRRTCGTYLACSPGIYGAAAIWLAARQLGHSVLVAEKSYTGRVRGIPAHHRTLDAVLGLEKLLAKIAKGRGTADAGRRPAVASA